MANSFQDRRLRITLVLGGTNAVFPGTNSNTLVVDNLRCSAVVKVVARVATEATIQVWGLKQADMNALSVIWANPPVVLDHYVIVEARNGDTWAQVFRGTMLEAQPDYSQMPNVPFVISAITGYFNKISPAAPTSYSGSVPIATLAKDLAGKMGFDLVDGGAEGVLKNPYYWGTMYDQFAQACADTNTDFYLLGKQIVITKFGQPRTTKPALVLKSTTGLIGSPQYERVALVVRALFDPAMSCAVPLQIESDVPNATGRWYPYAITHVLDARIPNGDWMSVLKCLRVL